MYKSIWARVLACLAVVVVLSLSVLPLLVNADQTDFAEESIFFTNTFYAALENPGGQSDEQRAMYISLVDKAYQIGLFGGAYPVTITMSKSTDEATGYRLEVFCINSISTLLNDLRKTSGWLIEESSPGTGGRTTISFKRDINSSYYTVKPSLYVMGLDGSWSCVAIESSAITAGQGIFLSGDGARQGRRFVVARRGSGNYWLNGNTANRFSPNGTGYRANTNEILETYNAILSNFQAGETSGFNEGFTAGYDSGIEEGYQQGFAEGYTDGYLDGSPQMIEIENVITAVPQGLKTILDNALDFEIFGINVAGLLSVLLIVSIVGFVVKWLMTR